MADVSRALLFGSYARHLQRSAITPASLPQRFAHLAPPLSANIRSGVQSLDKNHPRSKHIRLVQDAKVQPAQINPSLLPRKPKEARIELSGADLDPRAIGAPLQTITFDDETWITNVEAEGTFTLGGKAARLQDLFQQVSPENWASNAGDGSFYKESTPGLWTDGHFVAIEPKDAARRWAAEETLQLRERVEWLTSVGGAPSTAQVILTITDYKIRPQVPSFSYKFLLHHCEEYNFGVPVSPDILDIDDGWFKAEIVGGDLRVAASKRMHFNASRGSDLELAAVLNLLSPALVAVLMHELVYNGTLRILDQL